jgi:multisubunit Na+/H+ antiporter MnhB subunit
VLDTLARLLVPLLILVAAYLLWAGAHAPGGAFQAGAVLAAAGVLMLLAGWRLPAALAALPLRLVLVAGPATFLLFAVIALLLEGRLLQFSPEWAGRLILIIETTAMISIGATLIALFLGAPPNKEDRQ